MCSIPSDSSLQKRELSKEEIFDILAQASAMGIREVVLTGGEPLLRGDLFDICAESRRMGLRSIVTTNGTLMDAATAEKLISCGIGHLHFSLDGLQGSHDAMRGPGSFERTIEAIKTVNAERKKKGGGPSLGIACVIMSSNIEDLFPLLRCADAINVDVVTFLPLLKNNACTPERQESAFWPRPDQMDILDSEIEKIKNFKTKHTLVYEEPGLRLFSKYYR
ncbi:MAG: radical SAM protein, partial [Candidatus Omnitrophota bacterium]